MYDKHTSIKATFNPLNPKEVAVMYNMEIDFTPVGFDQISDEDLKTIIELSNSIKSFFSKKLYERQKNDVEVVKEAEKLMNKEKDGRQAN